MDSAVHLPMVGGGPDATVSTADSPAPPSGVVRSRGRPRTRLLDVEMIVDAASAIIRTDGLRGLTMRGLAARLGVSASALYNHVRSRAALLSAIQERFSERLDTSGFGVVSLREALARWAWSYLGQLREHPELVVVIVDVPLAQAPRTTAMYQEVVTGFAASGWPDEAIIGSMSVLETYIFGAALDSPAPDDVYAPHVLADAPELARSYDAFTAAVAAKQARPRDLIFGLGLDAALTGLHSIWGTGRGWAEVRLPARRPSEED